jgi:hypothetical protein
MDSPKYSIPGGIKLFFEEGTTGVLGFRDLGNLTDTDIESAITKLEHFTSRSGQRQKDFEAITQSGITLGFTFDEPNAYNLRWAFLGGDATDVTAGAVTVDRELLELSGTTARRTALAMASVPAVTVQAINGSPTTYVLDTDYAVSQANSTVTRIALGGIADGDFVMVSYSAQVPAHSRFPVLESPILEGRARLLVQPTAGRQFWWEMPKVQLAPNGALSLDQEDWMKAAMTLTILADTENNPTTPFGEIRTWQVSA